MTDLEKENIRLRRAVSDLTLNKLILQEAARGKRRRAQAQTSEPRAPQAQYRSYPGHDAVVRAADLPCARAASIDTAQGAESGG